MTNRIEVVQTYGRRVSRGASSKIRVYVSNLDKERRRDERKWPSRISNETLPICNRGVSPLLPRSAKHFDYREVFAILQSLCKIGRMDRRVEELRFIKIEKEAWERSDLIKDF